MDIKHTVALEPKRIVSMLPARPSASTTERPSGNVSAVQTRDSSAIREESVGSVSKMEDAGSSRLNEAVKELNSYVQNIERNLQFDVDEGSGHTVIRVLDTETDEVIRQMPSEDFLALSRHMKSMSDDSQGLLLKEKA